MYYPRLNRYSPARLDYPDGEHLHGPAEESPRAQEDIKGYGRRHAGELPIGLQIIGPRFAEPKILATAKLVHEANPTVWPLIAKSAARS